MREIEKRYYIERIFWRRDTVSSILIINEEDQKTVNQIIEDMAGENLNLSIEDIWHLMRDDQEIDKMCLLPESIQYNIYDKVYDYFQKELDFCDEEVIDSDTVDSETKMFTEED